MTRLSPRAPGRGFTLVELMLVMALLAVFFLAASHAFTSMLRLNRAGAESRALGQRWDGAIAALRADVWAARAITVADAAHLELDLGDDRHVQWRIEPHDPAGAALVRSEWHREAALAPEVWPELPAAVAFAADGAALVVQGPARRDGQPVQVHMHSQRQLVRAASAPATAGNGGAP